MDHWRMCLGPYVPEDVEAVVAQLADGTQPSVYARYATLSEVLVLNSGLTIGGLGRPAKPDSPTEF